MTILVLFLTAILVVLLVGDIRRSLIIKPIFALFKKVLPPLSKTEREAMEAGDTWWDGDLFSGNPDWNKLHSIPKPALSADEQHFMDHQVQELLAMLDDHQIVQEQQDLPQEVWQYLGKEGFFSLIIPKSYGGREFSAIANSTIVSAIASRSLSAAVTVMVPNSLGPGELLMHYGTEEQKERWLPGLAKGDEVPCFALTGPEAGSDAGAIPDTGVVCKGTFNGEEVIGVRLNFAKRYITLAPVATVVGLAFKLTDPDGLIGDDKAPGITCALIPAEHPGIEIGRRHNPLGLAFMNGTVYGEDVFIPADWIIGGPEYAGRGWRMLVECLSAGRGISLPALSCASGHLASRMTGAYSYVRRQFGLPIGQFEGVQESMARIGGMTYSLEAVRKMTAGALDLGTSPSVVTAIAKYHMTEMGRQVVSDAMDIHAGRGIQLGPKNYLGQNYMGIPISITVEGANILTRNLMIFGQGATRCHPYVLREMAAAANENPDEGLKQFDTLLTKHVGFAATNLVSSLFMGLTGSRFNSAPVAGPTKSYYQQLTRMSRSLALCADFSMLVLGGDLKRKEMISARLGDVLSHLYMASAVLKHYEDDGRQQGDLPLVHYAMHWHLSEIGKAFSGLFQNFPNRMVAWVMKVCVFPLGNRFTMVDDAVQQQVAKTLQAPSVVRDRLTHLCFVGDAKDDPTGIMERAFVAMYQVRALEKKIKSAQRSGALASKLPIDELLCEAVTADVLTADEVAQLELAYALARDAIDVDEFDTARSLKGQSAKPNAA
ncbi:acyl-CoA dehydrogenase [Neiella marina]|uniref:Acyl-coenzyme A dehydrogenase n=1 Tax=Neiella holothuriorum TaxID=2870530 RepID=A0ABS7EGU0_9GAMM|nr:acyl-CoA dehydrogenase [Neiella holothuriorum]MBW8191562.1 acyl-CoA dehydrogenase [Neiella holothuriorum]